MLKKAQNQLAADEHRGTQMKKNDLSAFIGGHLRLNQFFSSPLGHYFPIMTV